MREVIRSESSAAEQDERTSGRAPSGRRIEAADQAEPISRRAYAVEELPWEVLEAMANPRMDPRHERLNRLLED